MLFLFKYNCPLFISQLLIILKVIPSSGLTLFSDAVYFISTKASSTRQSDDVAKNGRLWSTISPVLLIFVLNYFFKLLFGHIFVSDSISDGSITAKSPNQ